MEPARALQRGLSFQRNPIDCRNKGSELSEGILAHANSLKKSSAER